MMKKFFALLLCLKILSCSAVAVAQVWQDTNQWTPEWEKNYEAWVLREWRVDYFARKTMPNGQSNPFAGLRTDCADTVYSMRILFSAENHLPFIALDPTGGNELISNRMKRWNSISSETQRIRQFLLFIYETMSTHSLPNDTYPVAISRDTVHSGGLMMTTAKNHHSWTLQNMTSVGVPHLIFNSTVGASSGSTFQERTSWPNPEWVFEGNFTPSGNAGFRYWRKASDLNKPVWLAEGYSDEQYKIPLNRWVDVVQKKLALIDETEVQKINRLLEASCAGVAQRLTAVKEGVDFLKTNGQKCMVYADYDTYSTPNRDHRVFDDLIALRRAYRQLVRDSRLQILPQANVRQLQKIFPLIQMTAAQEASQMKAQEISSDSVCVSTYGPGRALDLAEYKRRAFADLLSNNPHDSFEVRWGEIPVSQSSLSRKCQSWDSWHPDLSTEN